MKLRSPNRWKTRRQTSLTPRLSPTLSEAKIAEMWKTYNGKTVTLGIFRGLVSDAVAVGGTVSIVKDALSKFEPPAAKASEAKKNLSR